jgi:hypothetical protein
MPDPLVGGGREPGRWGSRGTQVLRLTASDLIFSSLELLILRQAGISCVLLLEL